MNWSVKVYDSRRKICGRVSSRRLNDTLELKIDLLKPAFAPYLEIAAGETPIFVKNLPYNMIAGDACTCILS